jgi:nucleoid-associated protein YgaU
MRAWIIVAGALLALPASAGTPRKGDGGDNLICRDQTSTGSRLHKKRICLTRSQWAEQKRIQRSELERLQDRTNRTEGK